MYWRWQMQTCRLRLALRAQHTEVDSVLGVEAGHVNEVDTTTDNITSRECRSVRLTTAWRAERVTVIAVIAERTLLPTLRTESFDHLQNSQIFSGAFNCTKSNSTDSAILDMHVRICGQSLRYKSTRDRHKLAINCHNFPSGPTFLLPKSLVCNFLLVINTNLNYILHSFQVMADYWSNFRWRHGSASLYVEALYKSTFTFTFTFNALAAGDPLRISG